MNVLIKEINDIIEKNNSKINENIVGINYLEKLKYLVINNLKDSQNKSQIPIPTIHELPYRVTWYDS